MNKFFLNTIIVIIAFTQSSFAQDSTAINSTELLHSYFGVKNALVSGDASTASLQAVEFVKSLRKRDIIISDDLYNGLLKDANLISESKNIGDQREYLATFSINMYTVVKSIKPGSNPVYYAYCPMRKAYWLSDQSPIRNPYYGNAMLTCGSVTEVIK